MTSHRTPKAVGKKAFKDFVVCQGVGPAVGGEDGGVEFLVGQCEPGGALVVEIGERAFGQFACGLVGVWHAARVADRADAARVGVGPGGMASALGGHAWCLTRIMPTQSRGHGTQHWYRHDGRRINVACPRAAGRAGKLQHLLARPLQSE